MTTIRGPLGLSSLRRVVAVPGLWAAICALQLGLAWALAQPIAAAARAAMGSGLWTHPDRLIAAFAELLTANPAVVTALTAAAIASAIFGAALALLLRGGVLARLATPGPGAWAEFGRATLGHLPVLALIALYGLVLRAFLTFVAHRLAGAHPLVELAALAILMSFATCTSDLASARRVVAGDRGVHPREYLRAGLTVARSPRLWLTSGLLSVARWALVAAILLVAVHGVGATWSPWAARALACVAVFLALWRSAVAVEATARPGT